MNLIIGFPKLIFKVYFVLGIIITGLIVLPYVFLGQDSLTRIHDTLEMGVGNLVTYVQSGKVFQFNATIDNIMNGLPHSAFPSPFYVVVWIFLIFKPFTAYVINELFVHVIAFTGMFLLLKEHFQKNNAGIFIVFGCSLCFAFVPFMPQLGLSVAGQPLLLYAFLNLLNNKQNKSDYVIIFIYPFYSYLALSGFFIIVALGLLFLWDYHKNGRINKQVLFGLMALVFAYGIVEHNLIKDYFFNTGFISHRTERNLYVYSYNFNEAIRQAISLFIHSQNHSVSLHTPILLSFFLAGIILITKKYFQGKRYIIFTLISSVAAFSLSISLCYYIWNGAIPKETISGMESKYLFLILALSSFIMIFILASMACFTDNKLHMGNNSTLLLLIIVVVLSISLFQGLYRWEGLMPLKKSIPLLGEFQLDRFYFLQPTLWYMLFAISLFIISRIRYGKYIVFIFVAFQMYYLVVNNNQNYNQLIANVKASYYKIKGEHIEPKGLTFGKFFSEKLFKEIKNYIAIPQKEYRVVSIGLHPAISTYNGFYALDGYIANYPLEYKHKFRKIIENELAKSKTWRELFDSWGSACYMFIAELDKFWFENTKDNHYQINNMKLNTEQLKSMGGKYIFSVFRIMNEKDNGLVLMKVFERDDSPWRIHLYKVI